MHEECTSNNRGDELGGRVDIVRPRDLVPGDHELDGQGDDGGHDEVADAPEVLEGQNTIRGYAGWYTPVSEFFLGELEGA